MKQRKRDMQKRLGARKTTLLPKLRRAVLLPYPPEPLPLGSLRNRDVDFWRIHKLPHHRGKKNRDGRRDLRAFLCRRMFRFRVSEWNWAFLLVWSYQNEKARGKKTQPEILQLFLSFWSPGQCCRNTCSANSFCCLGISHPRLAEAVF